MILVAGATGVLGSEICRQLCERGERVRGLVRSTSAPDKVAALRQRGVEAVVGDLRDPASLASACKGAEVVISGVTSITTAKPGDSFDTVDRGGNIALMDAAKKAGASQFVFVSFDATNIPDSPLVQAKKAAEARLKSSGLTYTLLHPGFFMESWLGPMLFADPKAGTATIYGSASAKISYVAVKDVAAVAVLSVRNKDARNATIAFGGPEKQTQREALRIFEEVFGRRFAVTEAPEAALESQFNSATDPMTKTFSSLILSLAQKGSSPPPPPSALAPDRLTSVRDFAAALRRTVIE